MVVEQIERAFLKGARVTAARRVQVDASGLRGDRRLVLVDEHGEQLYANRAPQLSRVEATLEANHLTLRIPGMAEAAGVLVPGDPLGSRAWDGGTRHGVIVEGPFAAALSGFLGTPVRLVDLGGWAGRGIDVEPVTIVSRQSIAALAERLGVAAIDHRRFRANLVVDVERQHQEDEWIGSRIRVGTAELEVIGPVPRCVVVTRDPSTGLRDADVLAALGRYRPRFERADGRGRGLPFAVYARVVEPGEVTVGDEIAPGAALATGGHQADRSVVSGQPAAPAPAS